MENNKIIYENVMYDKQNSKAPCTWAAFLLGDAEHHSQTQVKSCPEAWCITTATSAPEKELMCFSVRSARKVLSHSPGELKSSRNLEYGIY